MRFSGNKLHRSPRDQSLSVKCFFFFFSDPTNPSYFKERADAGQLEFSYFFFDGDANDPGIQSTIKMNSFSVMTSPMVPPFFCKFQPNDCNEDTIEVYAGSCE